MVTVLSSRNLKFKIFAKDHPPPHVHVEGGGGHLRINLLSLEPMDNETDFSASTLRMILQFVGRHRDLFIEQWEEYHGKERH